MRYFSRNISKEVKDLPLRVTIDGKAAFYVVPPDEEEKQENEQSNTRRHAGV